MLGHPVNVGAARRQGQPVHLEPLGLKQLARGVAPGIVEADSRAAPVVAGVLARQALHRDDDRRQHLVTPLLRRDSLRVLALCSLQGIEKGRAGRPLSALRHAVLAALVDPAAAQGLGVSDAKTQHLMRCSCKRHHRLLTIKAAHSNRQALHCALCRCSLSSHALAAAEVLDETGLVYAYEARVLRGKFGPLDFYIPELRLAIEVDGEQHFQGKVYGCPKALVQVGDVRKVRRAWEVGVRVLRVPYYDTQHYEAQLAAAAKACMRYPNSSFVVWSTDTSLEYSALQWRGDNLYEWHVRCWGGPPPP